MKTKDSSAKPLTQADVLWIYGSLFRNLSYDEQERKSTKVLAERQRLLILISDEYKAKMGDLINE
jgi:hypothetical protein